MRADRLAADPVTGVRWVARTLWSGDCGITIVTADARGADGGACCGSGVHAASRLMTVDCPTRSERLRVRCAYRVSVPTTCGIGANPGDATSRCPGVVAGNDRCAVIARYIALRPSLANAAKAAACPVNDRHLAAPSLPPPCVAPPLGHDASAADGGHGAAAADLQGAILVR